MPKNSPGVKAAAGSLVAAGKIIGCFGVQGYLKLQIYAAAADERLRRTNPIFLGRSADEARNVRLGDVIRRKKGLLIKFEGIDDRTSAEQTVGMFLFVGEESLVRPPKGSYFIHEIVGCEVSDEDGRMYGSIEDVHKFPGQDIWVVRGGGKEYLVPAVKEFIKKIDTAGRRVVIRVIEGLMEDR